MVKYQSIGQELSCYHTNLSNSRNMMKILYLKVPIPLIIFHFQKGQQTSLIQYIFNGAGILVPG